MSGDWLLSLVAFLAFAAIALVFVVIYIVGITLGWVSAGFGNMSNAVVGFADKRLGDLFSYVIEGD